MNIGVGIILAFIAIALLSLKIIAFKNSSHILGKVTLITGFIILICSVLLITGIYDPYANHI
ncbi:hypothetical protein CN918_30450 [Priestia megaterium]|nr:hypothetical protein CN918_30450 [Priestia megaterium]